MQTFGSSRSIDKFAFWRRTHLIFRRTPDLRFGLITSVIEDKSSVRPCQYRFQFNLEKKNRCKVSLEQEKKRSSEWNHLFRNSDWLTAELFAAVIRSPSSFLIEWRFRRIHFAWFIVNCIWRAMTIHGFVDRCLSRCTIANIFTSLRESYQINNFRDDCLRFSHVCSSAPKRQLWDCYRQSLRWLWNRTRWRRPIGA